MDDSQDTDDAECAPGEGCAAAAAFVAGVIICAIVVAVWHAFSKG